MTEIPLQALNEKLERLIEAVSRLAPAQAPAADFAAADCFVWDAEQGWPAPVAKVSRVDLSLIRTLGQEVGFGAKTPEQAGAELVSGATDILNRA